MTETDSLKSLANNALERLERNKTRNKTETKTSNLVSQAEGRETRKGSVQDPFFLFTSDLKESYEERVAICQYDGGLDPDDAERIATIDLLKSRMKVLSPGNSCS